MRLYTISFLLRRAGQRALDVLYPEVAPRCLLCQRRIPPASLVELHRAVRRGGQHAQPLDVFSALVTPGGGVLPLCLSCLQDARPVSAPRRVLALRSGRRLPVVAASPHEGLLRHAIRQWKYDRLVEVTPWLAAQLVQAVRCVWPAIRGPLVVPVPTTPAKLRDRGFYPVGLLAREATRLLGGRVYHALVQVAAGGASRAQVTRTAAERTAALRGAYQLAPDAAAVRGHTVLLIDDVVTTGATLRACAEVLLAAGAVRVAAGVIASET